MIEHWEFPQSNAKQQYATHSFLRYFGKLPPVVTRRILEESRVYLKAGPVVDVACGSGTTLVEAVLLGIPSQGLDINPLSVLVAKVKTTPVPDSVLGRQWDALVADVNAALARPARRAVLDHPAFRGRDLWFAPEIQRELAVLRSSIDHVPHRAARDFFLVAFAGIIRRASNASERAGRIFKEVGKIPPSPWALLQERVTRMRPRLSEFTALTNGHRPLVQQSSAVNTGLQAGRAGLVFFHPPYFALYKYSSDVLRFELEWLGFDRKEIAKHEIRDGFKTTRADDVYEYLADLEAVFTEARRLVHPHGALVVISNNSTLRKQELPIIPGIQKSAARAGFALVRHAVRAVRFAQSSYHRSADAKICTPRDHILFFEPA